MPRPRKLEPPAIAARLGLAARAPRRSHDPDGGMPLDLGEAADAVGSSVMAP